MVQNSRVNASGNWAVWVQGGREQVPEETRRAAGVVTFKENEQRLSLASSPPALEVICLGRSYPALFRLGDRIQAAWDTFQSRHMVRKSYTVSSKSTQFMEQATAP